jgi:hypothetical protein
MKNFILDVDFVMSKRIQVEAENEEHAISIARSKIDENPYGYAHGFSHYVGYEIIDANEEEMIVL